MWSSIIADHSIIRYSFITKKMWRAGYIDYACVIKIPLKPMFSHRSIESPVPAQLDWSGPGVEWGDCGLSVVFRQLDPVDFVTRPLYALPFQTVNQQIGVIKMSKRWLKAHVHKWTKRSQSSHSHWSNFFITVTQI